MERKAHFEKQEARAWALLSSCFFLVLQKYFSTIWHHEGSPTSPWSGLPLDWMVYITNTDEIRWFEWEPSLWAYKFEHLVPGPWKCLGSIRSFSLIGGGVSLRQALRFCSPRSPCRSQLSLSVSCLWSWLLLHAVPCRHAALLPLGWAPMQQWIPG